MSDLIIIVFILGLFPLILHEFGHWIILKKYDIHYKIFFNRYGAFGFKTFNKKLTKNELKAGLMGAFTPLLILIPILFSRSFTFLFFGLFVCLIYALWTCIEIWWNLNNE